MRQRFAALVVLAIAVHVQAGIRGTVMTVEGKPIAGAAVKAFAIETTQAHNERLMSAKPDRVPIGTATTSSSGDFVLDAGKATMADLQISATAYAPAFTNALGDDDIGAMVLAASPAKSGKVSAGGKPVAGALLVWGRFETRSGEDGTYSVPDAAARYVSVFHPDFAPLLNQPADPQRRNYDIALSTGMPVSGIVAGADGKTAVPHAAIRIDGYPIGESDEAGAFTIARAPRLWKEIQAITADQTGARTRREGISSIRIILGNAARLSGSVRDTAAKAVSGIPITLSRKDGGTSETVLTDVKGNFTFPPTLAGSYRLLAAHPSYVMKFVELSLPARNTTRRDLILSPAGRISGRVVDDGGKPVAAAAMAVNAALSNTPAYFVAQPERFSSPAGKFVLGGIDTDNPAWIVTASRRAYPTGKSEVLKLAPGELKANVTIVVPAGITVRGKVIDADRKPMAGVAVLSFERNQQNADGMLNFGISRSYDRSDQLQTGSDGTFAFRVKEGMYDLAFRREGFPVKVLKSTAVKPGLAPLEITLEQGVEMSGRALRPDGTPLAGASVNVYAQETPSPPPVMTDANGAFVITGLIPTMYQVSVYKQDESLATNKSVKAPARDVVLQVQEGSHVGAIVVDADHAPVLDFQAGLATSQVYGNSINRFGPPPQSFHTDDGHFRLEHVRAGPYELTVGAPGFVTKHLPVKIEEGKDLDDIEVELAHGGSLTFHVTGPDGSPLSGVNIRENQQQGGTQVMDFQNMLNGSTAENGEFTFSDLEAADKAFIVGKQGYVSQRKTVKVSGKETRADLQLSAGKTVSGSVVDSNGSPVPEARVFAFTPNSSGGSQAVSDANGNFRLEGMGSGRFTFSANKAGGGSAVLKDVDIDTLSGPVVLKMAAGGTIVGHVRGLTDRDYAGVTIQVMGERANVQATVDTTGAFRIENVSGTVRLFPYLRSNGVQRSGEMKNVDVTAGGEVTADVMFAEGVTIRGRITWGGKPATGGSIYVSFSSADPTVPSNGGGQADSEGRYEIPGLKPGKHDVFVSNATRRFHTTYTVAGSDTFDIDATGTALRGRVLDAQSGDPIAGALVTLQSVGDKNAAVDAGGMLSDAGGAFSFDTVTEGQYRVSAQKDKYSIRIVDVTVPGNTSAIDVKLAKLDGLRFRVVDARDGTPLAASFLALDAGGQVAYRGNFEPDGETAYVLPVGAGPYRVTIASWEWAPQTLTATAPSPEIRVSMRPGGKLSIRSKAAGRQRARLIGAGGEPVRLNAYNPLPEIILTEGLQQFDHIPSGSFTLQILDTNGSVQRSVSVTVAEGGAATIEI